MHAAPLRHRAPPHHLCMQGVRAPGHEVEAHGLATAPSSIVSAARDTAAMALLARGGPPPRQAGEPARADALRRLVPGGSEMEYCSLLDETADYLRSLRAQVQLMQNLVDLFSDQ